LCPSCVNSHAIRCYVCGAHVHERHSVSDDNISLCGRCVDNYYRCDSCNYLVHEDDVQYRNDTSYCGSCFDDLDDEEDCDQHHSCGGIHRYHYKPCVIIHRMDNENDPILLGVELETEGDRHLADDVVDMSDDERLFLLEEDGSIHNGFELVTHPCTLAYHHKEFPWKKLTAYLIENRFKSHDTTTCGLHIHTNKNMLSETDQTKIGLFIGFNSEIISKFGRRKYNNYCYEKKIKKGQMSDAKFSASRYEAVNFTNSSTVEFRFFKGTLKSETIIASLEFVHALCRYVKTHGFPTMVKPNWDAFCKFIAPVPEYRTLLTYLFNRKLTKEYMLTPIDCVKES